MGKPYYEASLVDSIDWAMRENMNLDTYLKAVLECWEYAAKEKSDYEAKRVDHFYNLLKDRK